MITPQADFPKTRGRPVIALFAIIGAWVLMRVLFWQSPLAMDAAQQVNAKTVPSSLALPVESVTSGAGAATGPEAGPVLQTDEPGIYAPAEQTWPQAPIYPWVEQPIMPGKVGPQAGLGPRMVERLESESFALATNSGATPVPARRIVGHNLLLAAGLSQLPVPPLFERYLQASGQMQGTGPVALQEQAPPSPFFAPATAQSFAAKSDVPRWSADAWMLWREDASNQSFAASQPSYGRSQVGAVIRYTLAPQSGHRPQAYLRASAALDGGSEKEMAVGLSARPVAAIPARLAGEARVTDRATQTELRAAAYVVSELPPVELPAGVTAEAYVQAGYVTGDFETGFVDGQARLTKDLLIKDDFRLSAGGGAWGGAQEGASRLDVGPSASVTFRLGEESFGRLSADYRVRVAGDASPARGPALTLSAGF